MTDPLSPFVPVSGSADTTPPAPSSRRSVASDLLDRRTASRPAGRVTIALVGLAVIALVILHVGVDQGARGRLARERWEQLAQATDRARDQFTRRIDRLGQAARFAGSEPSLARDARAVRNAANDEHALVTSRFDGARRAFGFESIELLDPRGEVLVVSGRAPDLSDGLVPAGNAPGTWIARDDADGANLVFTVPLAGGAERGTVRFTTPLASLMQQPGSREDQLGVAAHVALVQRRDAHAVYLTAPPPGAVGVRVPIGGVRPDPAALAVQGVEARLEQRSDRGAVWSLTRGVPEIGCALVVQADRDVMMRGAGAALVGLLILDAGLLAVAGAGFAWWRRRRRGAAEQSPLDVERDRGERVQAVFDHAFDAIVTFDARGRVRAANRAAERLFQRSAEELAGEPLHCFMHWAVATRPGTLESLPVGTVQRSEAMNAEGGIVPVEFSLACSGEGEALQYTAIVRDVSDRIDAEHRVRSFAQGLEVTNRRLEEMNAQLEEASRLKSEFLANTSHELRTPLNGMIGFLQLVLDGMCDSPEEEREFLKQALHCSRHLLGLINDVLDIAKIEAGKLTLEIEPVDVRAMFDEVYTVTHVQADQKGLALAFIAPETPQSPVRGDAAKIKQVLINLVGNSIKFTAGGSITVRAEEHAELGHYMFEVVDTGVGVAPDRQRVIFEKFTQGDGSTTRKFGGTGLGLAISRSLVERMGGIIGVHSEGEGKGTRMFFSLPAWRSEAADAPHGEGETAADADDESQITGPAGGALLLVVEDDPVFRRFMVSRFHQHGYRTVEAAHAEAGWVLARRLRPAVVVLDYALSSPEGASLRTGWDLAERMATDPRTRHTGVVFVTGFEAQLLDKLRSTAFARQPEHVMKPVDGAALIAKIESMLQGSEATLARVLLADDDPAVAAYLTKVLPEHRYQVEVVNRGEDCLHLLRTQPRGFDLLLLDLMMPDVSGYDVLREMTLTGRTRDLPVIVLTNFPEARTDDERRLLDEGIVLDVISKTAVHDNPALLPHIIDWHLQVALGDDPEVAADDERLAA